MTAKMAMPAPARTPTRADITGILSILAKRPLPRICLVLMIPAEASPQRIPDANAHGWFMYFGDHPVKGRWGAHMEGQYRRHNIVTRWQQLLLRPAVNYELNRSVMLTGGYAFVKTHGYGAFPVPAAFPEHRLFEQLLARHRAGRVSLQHRFRLEQRWIGVTTAEVRRPASWRSQQRFRYFIKGTIPLGGTSPWFLAGYNEILLHFGSNYGASAFDHNRAYGALGYTVNRFTRIEVGYLNQYLYQRSGRSLENNHTLQFSVFSTLPLGK